MLADYLWFAKRDEEAHRFKASYRLLATCPFGRQWAKRCDRRDEYWREVRDILQRTGARHTIWYDELWAYEAADRCSLPDLVERLPPRDLLHLLGDKVRFRHAATALPLLPGRISARAGIDYAEARRLFPAAASFAIHGPTGSACSSLRLMRHATDEIFLQEIRGAEWIVTPLLETMVPINVHIFVGPRDVVVAPPSLQLLSLMNGARLFYAGCDFSVGCDLSPAQRRRIDALARATAHWLRERGYSGVAGLDMLIDEQEICLVEINARFQASTCVLNQALRAQGRPTAQELHLLARSGASMPSLADAVCSGGMVIVPRPASAKAAGWDRTVREKRDGRIAKRPFGIFPQAIVQPGGRGHRGTVS